MTLVAVTPPTLDNIVTLAEVKARVRVVEVAEDADLELMLRQAVDQIERYSGVALDRRDFRLTDKQFCRAMPLPIGPVTAVTAVEYDDASGNAVTLDSAAWKLGDGALFAAPGTSWPYASGLAGAVRVTFTAGLENAKESAPMLVAAVLVGVAALFANREAPDWSAAMACADSYRMPGL